METQVFYIRSLMAQNLIMAFAAAIIIVLLVNSIRQRKQQHAAAIIIWALITMWFFNSPFWGFSAVTVSPTGIEIHYGFLSVYKNTRLLPDTSWKIHVYMGGIRRMKKLYYLELADHQSLKVRGQDKVAVLQSIGAAIDQINGMSMGAMEERPVNF